MKKRKEEEEQPQITLDQLKEAVRLDGNNTGFFVRYHLKSGGNAGFQVRPGTFDVYSPMLQLAMERGKEVEIATTKPELIIDEERQELKIKNRTGKWFRFAR